MAGKKRRPVSLDVRKTRMTGEGREVGREESSRRAETRQGDPVDFPLLLSEAEGEARERHAWQGLEGRGRGGSQTGEGRGGASYCFSARTTNVAKNNWNARAAVVSLSFKALHVQGT